MKRIIWFLILVLLTLSANSQSIFRRGVIIGNQKAGSDVVKIDSATTQGTDITFYNSGAILTPTVADFDLASDYYIEKSDSNTYGGGYITRPYLESRLGSGGGSAGFSYYSKEFQVGDTGFPTAGDSVITSADWAGRDVKVWRDGLLQRRRLTADGKEGARINNTTGAVTVHPPFSALEEIVIEATDPTARYEAVISTAQSSLRTRFIAGWQLDESSGNSAYVITGYFPGTNTNVTVNATG